VKRALDIARWPGWLALLIGLWGFLLFANSADRGFNYYGGLQIDQTNSALRWLDEGSSESLGLSVYSNPVHGPMGGLVPALMADGDDPTSVLAATRNANALFVVLTVLALFGLGLRAGGPLVAVCAAVGLLSVPRIWGAATAPGLTAPALFAMTAAAIAVYLARDHLRWALPAIAVTAFATVTTQLSLLIAIPWIWWIFVERRGVSRPDQRHARGLLSARPLAPWSPVALPLGVGLGFLLVGLFAPDGLSAKSYLRAYLEVPRESTLYFGDLFGDRRIPWHAAPVMTVLTVPPTIVFLAFAGLVGSSPFGRWARGQRSAQPLTTTEDTLGFAISMLALTAFIPLLLGTLHSHGVDLLALMTPWVCLIAASGLVRVMRLVAERLPSGGDSRRTRPVGLALIALLGWSVFAFAFVDTRRAYPAVESYYSWLVNGVDGAAEAGLPRYSLGPPPVEFIEALVGDGGQATMAILPGDGFRDWPTLERYRSVGRLPAGLLQAPPQEADIVLFTFDERSHDYYDQLPEFLHVAGQRPDHVRWLRVEGLPLYGAVRLD